MAKATSFTKFTIKEGMMGEFEKQMTDSIRTFTALPGVLSMTMAKTGPNEIRSLVVYDKMESLELNSPKLKEIVGAAMPCIEEGGFERWTGEVFVEG